MAITDLANEDALYDTYLNVKSAADNINASASAILDAINALEVYMNDPTYASIASADEKTFIANLSTFCTSLPGDMPVSPDIVRAGAIFKN